MIFFFKAGQLPLLEKTGFDGAILMMMINDRATDRQGETGASNTWGPQTGSRPKKCRLIMVYYGVFQAFCYILYF